MEGEHWRKNKPAGRGRAGSCWIAELMECPFYFAVKEVSHFCVINMYVYLNVIYLSQLCNFIKQVDILIHIYNKPQILYH